MSANLVIKNAAQLVTANGFSARRGRAMAELTCIENAALIIKDGIIAAVGKTPDILGLQLPADCRVIDAAGQTIVPGFVDSHTHLVFGGYRAEEFSWRLRGDSYMEIMQRGGGILSTVNATRSAGHQELIEAATQRLDSMLSFGVTTVEAKSGYGLDRDTEIKQLEVNAEINANHPIDVVSTFMGAHAVLPEFKGREDDFIDLLVESVLPGVAQRNLAEFCDVFCEKNVFSVGQSRRLLQQAQKLGLKSKIHADEMVSLGGAELAAELGAVSADHLLHASDRGVEALAAAGVVCTLLPGTAFSLKEPYARARFMIEKDCAVSLATDFNPGSCYTESIPLVIALATLYMHMSPAETLTALTLNGAAALNRADRIGSLQVGKAGDLVILQDPSFEFLAYHIGVNRVDKVVKGGTLVYERNRT